MLNDLFVLTKIKEGDVKAFEGIFRLYYSPLCLYAAGITGSMDVAEEIVQELFYVFWKEKEKLQVFRSSLSNTANIRRCATVTGKTYCQVIRKASRPTRRTNSNTKNWKL